MATQLEVTGTIKQIGQTQQVSEKFSKREFVIETKNGEYSDLICFQCVKDKTAILDNFRQGQEVKVSFNLSSKEHNGRYFTNATCWRIEAQQNGDNGATGQTGGNTGNSGDNQSSDLPF